MAANAGRRVASDGDGPQSGAQTFADELRAQREAAELTQEQLAKLMGYSPSVIAKLETCRTIASPDHAKQADKALHTPQTFQRLRKAMINGAYEAWVRAYLEIEERATVLRSWQPLVIPGLLQTEAYARALIRAGRPGDSEAEVEQIVMARMARQSIWDREAPPPPMLCAVLGEAVLRQRVGDASVMREQLGRLVEAAQSPRVIIQVMPASAGAHPGMLGNFEVASFEEGPDAAYLDNALTGHVTERRKEVARVNLLYDTMAREALSPGASVDMVSKAVQEWT
jgi:transcriptional regulator with XRE-family HTH domain